ncbi:hypothetical protein ACSQ76_12850 [Roseovarius sp. B08]|uniref:hypothetical protein n=1 Tax=Roseovarius sp. B08 TaxID=3449223 RepID=UPI003EDBB4DB
MSVVKGAGGEFERNPAKDIAVFGLRAGQPWETTLPASRPETRRLSESAALTLTDLWQNRNAPAFEADVITGTAALALDTLGADAVDSRARMLWQTRAGRRAA